MSLLNLLIPAFTGFVFMIPVLMLWFHHLHRSGHSVSRLHQAGVYLFCYYLFVLLLPLRRVVSDGNGTAAAV
ncbi:hypothetical protein [uncultured Faecalibaculum sp.]|uniref:hypothetical protein n=1 Tax=uncultured Faecalibaculum sp. TaxID=1729681 RepID=UPI002674AE97|nr:hypothetical protein [uncultured Faecalibaculum sp.]